METVGSYGFITAFDIERKLLETRLFITAPVARNLARDVRTSPAVTQPLAGRSSGGAER